jgi:flagellar biosynthesis GTPase FlhF
MRLKTYQASTTQEAMQLIREQLGPDAISSSPPMMMPPDVAFG